MHNIDSTDAKGGVLGFLISMIASLLKLGFMDFFIEFGYHLLLGAAGTLGGLLVARFWKKYIDKKK